MRLATARQALPLFLLFLSAVAVSPQRAVSQDATSPANQPYRVEPGDQIEISFFTAAGIEVREISGTRTVDRTGAIYLPYVGRAEIEGLDADGIRSLLAREFEAFYQDPVIEVAAKLRVNVTGAVRNPGHFYVDPASTLVDALAIAGGAGQEVDVNIAGGAADQARVHLVRNGSLEVLDFRPQTIARNTIERLIESGDWLYVPPRGRSRVRENITFVSSIVTLAATIVGIGVLLSN